MKRAIVAVTILLLSMSLLARQPQTRGATVAGIVLRAGTPEPLQGAQAALSPVNASSTANIPNPVVSGSADGLIAGSTTVSVSSSSGSSKIPPGTTSLDGRFEFQNLEPGVYTLQVFRNEYARQNYGQRVPGGPVT